MSLFFAAAPLLLLVYLMTRRHALPAHVALPVAAVVAYVVRLGWFGNDPTLVHAAVLSGLLTAWTPILIVWGAILLFRTMERSGAMAVVREWLRQIGDHPVAQLTIVGWAFAFLIEGASGFGTPAALAAPLLVGMGYPAVRVAVLTLVMNSVPVTFGAVGTPIWFGLGELGPPPLSPADLLAVSWRAALLLTATALVVPVLALGFVVPWRALARNLGFVYLSVFSCVLPMLALSFVSYEFAALGGGLIGLLATVALARAGVGLRPMTGAAPPAARPVAVYATARAPAGLPVGGSAVVPALERPPGPPPAPGVPAGDLAPAGGTGGAPGAGRLVKALFPLWGVVVLLVVTRVEPLGLKELLKLREPAWSAGVGSFGEIEVSAALVVALRDIFGTALDWTHETLYVPSILPFFAVAAVTWRLYRLPGRVAWDLVADSWRSLARPIVALMAALVFVKLLMVEQTGAAPIPAATTSIGASMADIFGGAWPLAAPFLGELGAFFSGSATVSNLTFGPIQDAVASDLGLDRFAVLAQQAAGAGMGNMVCIHNIVAVCSVLGLLGGGRDGAPAQPGVEGFILRRTIVPALAAGLILGLVGALFQLG